MVESSSRTNIIEASHELMLKRGYAATSVDDICVKAGVSKGSFYHFFESKEELGLTVLEAFYRTGLARVRSGGFVRMTDPGRRLRGFFDHLEKIAPDLWRHGCLLGSFAGELVETSPRIHRRVAALFDDLVKLLAPIFRAATRDDAEATALAEQTLMVLEGAIVVARAHDDPGRIALGVRRFRRAVEASIHNPRGTREKVTRSHPARRRVSRAR
jgi:TetR/AcrR family transcriptional repressor of nem operon